MGTAFPITSCVGGWPVIGRFHCVIYGVSNAHTLVLRRLPKSRSTVLRRRQYRPHLVRAALNKSEQGTKYQLLHSAFINAKSNMFRKPNFCLIDWATIYKLWTIFWLHRKIKTASFFAPSFARVWRDIQTSYFSKICCPRSDLCWKVKI